MSDTDGSQTPDGENQDGSGSDGGSSGANDDVKNQIVADRDKQKQRAHKAEANVTDLLASNKELQKQIDENKTAKAKADGNVTELVSIEQQKNVKLAEENDKLLKQLTSSTNELRSQQLLDGILQKAKPEARDLVKGQLLLAAEQGEINRFPEEKDISDETKKAIKLLEGRNPGLFGTAGSGGGVPGIPGFSTAGKPISELTPEQQRQQLTQVQKESDAKLAGVGIRKLF